MGNKIEFQLCDRRDIPAHGVDKVQFKLGLDCDGNCFTTKVTNRRYAHAFLQGHAAVTGQMSGGDFHVSDECNFEAYFFAPWRNSWMKAIGVCCCSQFLLKTGMPIGDVRLFTWNLNLQPANMWSASVANEFGFMRMNGEWLDALEEELV